ncbi:amino acid ABC transporter ATP-binding protein [Schaalia vaccimaxillae]|uniref:amino acid ABC transporter ATP-binding protein n=1 Tax=Schaalia vaccimaxillae TaxID=183916 RepID=UPI0003B5F3F5|nr:amino acid ABC transporter ATP-binding protein [Schaalia vaccimaxillae]
MIYSPTSENLTQAHPEVSDDPQPLISIRGLTKSFGNLRVLDDVNLDVARGQVTGIIGPSGGGKSTLLRCINLLETPDSGTVRVGSHVYHGSQRIAEADLRALRAKTGMVFQSYDLFPHLDVLSNVTLAQRRVLARSKDEARDRAMTLLARVGLADRANARPAELSGGQKQRVAIARALALDPEVLLFDEPTSALDPELSREVLAVIRDLADEGRTMMVVTHEVSFARDVADQLVVIVAGRIYTSEELVGHPTEGADDAAVASFATASEYLSRVLAS